MKIRTYSELIRLPTFEDRFRYLSEGGLIGDQTFGGSRFLNQDFYRSVNWKRIRDIVIVRDCSCDLAIQDRPIHDRVVIHHMVPLRKDDIVNQSEFLLDPEYLVCVSYRTHNAIHYGSDKSIQKDYTPRRPNDTCPWR